MPLVAVGILMGMSAALLYAKIKTDEKSKEKMPRISALRKIKESLAWGNSRSKQLQKISFTPPGDSEAEKQANRSLVIASSAVGLIAGGTLLSPALIPFGVALILYNSTSLFTEMYASIFKDKKVRIVWLDTIFMVACLTTGSFFIASLGGWFYFLSKKLVNKTEDYTQKSLLNVFEHPNERIWVVREEGVEIEMPLTALKIGDIVVVNAGETISIDGIITSGIASIDQHILTGESNPAEKGVGELVFASTIVLTGSIYIEVEKTGEDTTTAKINQILNQTTDYKNTLQSRGQVIADSTVLPMLGIGAVALFSLGPIGAATVVNSNFGYNMRLLAPIGMMNYLNLASTNGILIKDGRALELLHKVDTIVFDKTGTLTHSQPHVGQIYACDGYTENEVLKYAAAAEYKQTHPIAKAILKESKVRQLTLLEIDEAEYKIGYGLKATIHDQLIRVGSSRFMEMEEIFIGPKIMAVQKSADRQGYSLVMIATNNQLMGAIELHATTRSEAKKIIHGLRQRNIKHVHIISGDHEEPTKKLAQELGMDSYFANTLPEEKACLIKQLQERGQFVCYVGDGINDSIALKQSNVSISLRGASSIAIDTANIVLMDSTLNQLGKLFDIAKEFDKNLETSLIITIAPGLMCISGAFLLHFGIMASVLLNQVGLIIGTANSVWPLIKHRLENDKQHKNSPQQ
jgi:heavy metal translocating P-type ATPase